MEADPDDQQRAVMMPLPERLAQATTNPLSPSDLMISSTGSGASGTETGAASTIALARVNRLPLLHWLVGSINGMLAGEVPSQPRPTGTLLECGRFVAAGTEVWAHDWYGHGHRCLLARSVDPATAEEFATRLNRLLRPERTLWPVVDTLACGCFSHDRGASTRARSGATTSDGRGAQVAAAAAASSRSSQSNLP